MTVIPDLPRAVGDRLGIAAIWWTPQDPAGHADIDLYCSAGPGLGEASWRAPFTTRVRHFRDIRRARRLGTSPADPHVAWECVQVERPDFSKISLWLDLYFSRTPVQGVIRFQWRGRSLDQPFHFDRLPGDGGRDAARRRTSPFWQEVRLPAALLTNSPRQEARP
ncbi:MAG: hypothetical protein KGS61_16700 [Verrucomicrobia bacterium]|nr:hypothetical protein [Verrucomicrobiota bacterium]